MDVKHQTRSKQCHRGSFVWQAAVTPQMRPKHCSLMLVVSMAGLGLADASQEALQHELALTD
jgi:hypothetical protein